MIVNIRLIVHCMWSSNHSAPQAPEVLVVHKMLTFFHVSFFPSNLHHISVAALDQLP